jgi:polyvinyl alcohol dehydrogenase (cytochrome)
MWKTYTIEDSAYYQSDGRTPSGFSGAAVWSGTPVVDRKRHALYVTTGNNYSVPSGNGTLPPGDHIDSIISLDMDTGAIRWSQRMTTGDLWTAALYYLANGSAGPDWDFGAGANLFQALMNGVTRDVVGAGQKSGVYWAVDPDTGSVLWHDQVGPGGHFGGIHWGTAVDGLHVYVGVNDDSGGSYSLGGAGPQKGQRTSVGSWAALDPSTGSIEWQVANPAMTAPLNGASVNGPLAVAGGVVFGGSMDSKGTMFAFDGTSGAVLWSFASGGAVYGGAAVAGGVVYWGNGYPASRLGYGSHGGNLYAFQIAPPASP